MGAQVGAFGNLMEWIGANPTFGKVTILNTGRNLKQWHNFEDFLEGYASVSGIWTSVFSGVAANVYSAPGTALRPGIHALNTGTTAAGAALIYAGGGIADGILLGGGEYTVETDIYITALSTAAEEYALMFGIGDTAGADMVDGCYFRYDRALAGVNWRIKTASNSVRTDTDSTVAVASGAWTRLKVVVNAAGTLVSYWINEILVGTNTLTIPTGAGRGTKFILDMKKSVGITVRFTLVDWIWVHYDLAASR